DSWRTMTVGESVRSQFLEILGGFPASEPLAARVVDEHHDEGYARRLVEYRVNGEPIRAFLFLPSQPVANRRLPGIVAIHQDGNRPTPDIGKSEPAGMAGDA